MNDEAGVDEALVTGMSWLRMMRLSGIDLTVTAHLKTLEEAKEFALEPSLEEAADVILTIAGAAINRGWTIKELGDAIVQKILINMEREWVRSEDGTYRHKD